MVRKCTLMMALLLSIPLMVTGCSSNKEGPADKNAVGSKVRHVVSKPPETITAQKKPIKKIIISEGRFTYKNPTDLCFKTGNLRVSKVYVKRNDKVTKGELLAELDTDSLQGELETWAVRLEKAQLSLNKLKVLQEQEGGHKFELLSAEKEAKLCKDKVGFYKGEISGARITAPMSGIISEADVQENDIVRAYQWAFQLVDPTDLRFECTISINDNSDLNGSAIGDPSGLAAGMKGVITCGSKEDIKLGCTLKSIDFPVAYDEMAVLASSSDQQLTSADLVFDLDESVPDTIIESSYGEIRLDTGITIDSIALPKEALISNKAIGKVIVTVLHGGRQKEREVKIGFYNKEDNLVEIKEGLSEGEQVLK